MTGSVSFMSSNAEIVGGEEYSPPDSFPVINLWLVYIVIELKKKEKVTPVCLDSENEIISSMPFYNMHLQNSRLLILLFGAKFLSSVQLQRYCSVTYWQFI